MNHPKPNDVFSERMGSGDGVTRSFQFQVGYAPFRPDSLLIKCGEEIIEPDIEPGQLKSKQGTVGHYNSNTGQVFVFFNEPPKPGEGVIVTYRYMPRSCGIFQMYTDNQGRITLIPVG